ncbi:unnamed protein product, partial [Oppiella nova]
NEFRGNSYFGGEGEESVRRQIFETNYAYITAHNAEADKGLHTFRLGVNQFADMTNEEYRQLLNLKVNANQVNNTYAEDVDDLTLPISIDWRTKGVVTPVKNQGQCGSCFAFSTVDSIESNLSIKPFITNTCPTGQYAINTGNLVTLAPQQIVDCIYPGRDVCKTGGDPVDVIELVIKEGGIEKESDYSYQARSGICQYTKSKKAVSVTGLNTLQTGRESALKAVVGRVGPVAVAIDAGHQTFQLYTSGVYVDSACRNDIQSLNHGVLAVGYGSEKGQGYWLIKNSWGAQWGAQGYIKLARNNNNQCGVATYGVYPIGVQ